MKLKSLALTLIATTSLGLVSPAVWAAEFNLTYSTTYTPTHPYGQADEEWIARIHEQTNGRVEITAFWGGSLITSREGIDELNAGVADMAYIAPIYASSGYDLNRLTPQFFYGYEDARDVLRVYMALWEEYPQYTEELEGAQVLGYNVGTPMHLMLRGENEFVLPPLSEEMAVSILPGVKSHSGVNCYPAKSYEMAFGTRVSNGAASSATSLLISYTNKLIQ